MARIQLTIPDEDRDRLVAQARREGMTLSAWLRVAAFNHLKDRQPSCLFANLEDLERFFHSCDGMEDSVPEPDWEGHLKVMNKSRRYGVSDS